MFRLTMMILIVEIALLALVSQSVAIKLSICSKSMDMACQLDVRNLSGNLVFIMQRRGFISRGYYSTTESLFNLDLKITNDNEDLYDKKIYGFSGYELFSYGRKDGTYKPLLFPLIPVDASFSWFSIRSSVVLLQIVLTTMYLVNRLFRRRLQRGFAVEGNPAK